MLLILDLILFLWWRIATGDKYKLEITMGRTTDRLSLDTSLHLKMEGTVSKELLTILSHSTFPMFTGRLLQDLFLSPQVRFRTKTIISLTKLQERLTSLWWVEKVTTLRYTTSTWPGMGG